MDGFPEKILLATDGSEDAALAGRAFGANGTPSAVLIDGEGKIASEVAVGAPSILELARANKGRIGES